MTTVSNAERRLDNVDRKIHKNSIIKQNNAKKSLKMESTTVING